MLVHKRLVSGATIFMILANTFSVTLGFAMGGLDLLEQKTTAKDQVKSTRNIQSVDSSSYMAAVMGPQKKSVRLRDVWRQQELALQKIQSQERASKRQNQQAFFAMGLMAFLQIFKVQNEQRMAQRQMYWERVRRQEQYNHELRVLDAKHRHELQMLIIRLQARGYSSEEIKSIVRNEQVRKAVERTRQQPTFEGSIFSVPQVNENRDYHAGRASMIDFYMDRNNEAGSYDWYKEFRGNDVAAFDSLDNKRQYETIKSEINGIEGLLSKTNPRDLGVMLSSSVQGADTKSYKELLLARCDFVLHSIRNLEKRMGVNMRSLEVYKSKLFALREGLRNFDETSYGKYRMGLAKGQKFDEGARQEFECQNAQVTRTVQQFLTRV